jgi:hypothetical protein
MLFIFLIFRFFKNNSAQTLISLIKMARVVKTWESQIVIHLKSIFGWQEGEANREVGTLLNLPNRSAFSSLFIAGALEFRSRLIDKFPDSMKNLRTRMRETGNQRFPSALIPEIQEEELFPTQRELENLINRVVKKLKDSKTEPKSANEKTIYDRERNEIVSYFLMIIDFQAMGSAVGPGEEVEEDESELSEED